MRAGVSTHRFGLLVAMLLAAALTAPAEAQLRPHAAYESLETPHFRVTFGRGLEAGARRAAEVAERARALLVAELTEPPKGKVDIVLMDDVDFSNGFANVFPSNRIVLYARPPVDDEGLGYNADWLELVVSHELTHIYQLDRAGKVGRALRTVFGRLPLIYPLFPIVSTPGWSIEGLAVDIESQFTGSGRVLGSHHEMVLRTAVLEGELDRMDRLNESSPIWPGDQRVYIYGSLFMRWLRERYGDNVHRELTSNTAGAVLPPFLFFDNVAKRTIGKSFDEAYAEWHQELQRKYTALADSVGARGLTQSERLTAHPRRALFPRVSPDGRRIAYAAEDGRSVPQLRVIDAATGDELQAWQRNGLASHAWASDETLLLSQLEFRGTYQIYNDLYTFGEGGRRITRGARLQDPDVSRTGRIVAVQNGGSATWLSLVDANGNAKPITHAHPDTLWSFPRWSPDGQRIAAIRWRQGGYFDVVVIDTTGAVVSTALSDTHMNQSPAFSPDGRWLLFSSDRTGITNLYAADLTTSPPALRQVTNVLTGAFQPDVSPDARWIYFSAYHAEGYAIERMPFDPGTWRDPAAERPRIAERANGNDSDGSSGASQVSGPRPYSPWRSLAPKAWQPALERGGRTGTYLGVAITGEDLVGRHAFDAWAVADVEGSGRWEADFSYRNARLGNPTFSIEASRYWDDLGNVSADTVVSSVFEREDRLAALMTLARRRYRSSVSVSVGVERETFLRELGRNTLRLRDAHDNQLALLGRFGFSTARTPQFGISREDGVSFSASVTRSREDEGTVYRDSAGEFRNDYTEWRGVAAAYKAMPIGGFAHHVLALRASGYLSEGQGASLSNMGGSTGGSAAILGYGLGRGTRLLPVRGFESGVLAGTRAWTASAEWRIPLALVGRRPSLSPFFIDRISAAAFTDAGKAWCTEDEEEVSQRCRSAAAAQTPLMSAGGELIFDIAFAGIFATRLRTGFAVPFRGPERRGRFYIELGSNY